MRVPQPVEQPRPGREDLPGDGEGRRPWGPQAGERPQAQRRVHPGAAHQQLPGAVARQADHEAQEHAGEDQCTQGVDRAPRDCGVHRAGGWRDHPGDERVHLIDAEGAQAVEQHQRRGDVDKQSTRRRKRTVRPSHDVPTMPVRVAPATRATGQFVPAQGVRHRDFRRYARPGAVVVAVGQTRRMFAGFRSEFVDVGRTTLFVRSAGEGPPVLLLHGHPRTSAT